jgi:hypothetical protein
VIRALYLQVHLIATGTLASPMAPEPKHFRVTYNQVHNLIKRTAKQIAEFKPDVLLAIGKNSNF